MSNSRDKDFGPKLKAYSGTQDQAIVADNAAPVAAAASGLLMIKGRERELLIIDQLEATCAAVFAEANAGHAATSAALDLDDVYLVHDTCGLVGGEWNWMLTVPECGAAARRTVAQTSDHGYANLQQEELR